MAKNGNRNVKRSTQQILDKSQVILPESEEQIRRRAYELYEERGRVDGFADQDWQQAEQELVQGKSIVVQR